MKNLITRIRNLFLFFLCLFYKIIGILKKDKVEKPKTVLVIQLAWLGDMVCTTPVFRAIKDNYPDCRVVVMGMSRNEKILDLHKDVDRFIVWQDNYSYIKDQLKNENIDFACSLNPNYLALCFLYLLGISRIAVPKIVGGYSPYESKLYKILIKLIAIVVPHKMGNYAPQEYLKLLEPIGIFSNNTKKTLFFSDQAKKQVEDLFLKRNIDKNDFLVAISPSAGNKIKNWPARRFGEVADYLIEKYKVKIFIIGTKMDKEEVEEMLNNMSYKSEVVNTYGTMSIDVLKALISRMKAFISVDTGPIYIAEAFDVPTIDIIGPMDENEQPPRGVRHVNIIDPLRGGPIIHIMNSRVYDKEKARKSIENISVKMVTDAFDNLYKII